MSTKASSTIWFYALGYFLAYVPYSALTKAVSSGRAGGTPLSGLAMLPTAVSSSLLAMLVFLTAMGWWRFAGRRRMGGFDLPCPDLRTTISGLATATVVITTTLAYTFEGISIVLAMVLMRGGVLVLAPITDALTRRPVRVESWVALALSFTALLVTFSEKGGAVLSLPAVLDISAYLAAYFVRLRLMSGSAKSTDVACNRKFFVEEQMVATPAALLVLVLVALAGPANLSAPLISGFTDVWTWPLLAVLIGVGICSQGTGVFGGLILLEPRENSYCVPVNRASSVLAGVLASSIVAVAFDIAAPSAHEMAGAGLILLAVLALGFGPRLAGRG